MILGFRSFLIYGLNGFGSRGLTQGRLQSLLQSLLETTRCEIRTP